ncbi:anti-sigma-28 factor, FlgM family [Acetitomaculum ruminis DSM 5522]|uniref:Negative regulator of flagellin synthesis n=1 Tax=Acetitomaculum ruminis DSM 5522 TaxID=1120918 RepID=A0A1I0WKD3_9FIRM|nr:flagellar biosynthesis anti-sigma factor FlgM [Acetitomaculum ruminis]SFA88857.1 anti-sigma-28 factor, FlgM family [Acetitomaculum ruminis DSM 5522]
MRIDALSQVSAAYKVNRAKSVSKTQYNNIKDQVSISDFGKDYQIARKAVAEASDIREDLVSELKNKIDNGDYEVSADDFATKLLEAMK